MTISTLQNITKSGEQFDGHALVKSVQVGATNGGTGSPFLTIALGEKSKTINCKLWDRNFMEYSVADLKKDVFKVGSVLRIVGTTSEYRGEIQLTISQFNLVKDGEVDISDFVETAPEPTDKMQEEFEQYLEEIQNPFIKTVCFDVYSEFKEAFITAPAAKSNHQAYHSGLLYHTLSMLRIAKAICSQYKEANRDIVYGAISIHDIGKVVELTGFIAPDYTKVGNFLGHITIGTMFIDRKIQTMKEDKNKWTREDFELGYELMHAVLAHHGELAYGSPVVPHTLEAMIVHQIDMMDSRINMVITGLDDDTIDPNEPKKIYPLGLFYKTSNPAGQL